MKSNPIRNIWPHYLESEGYFDAPKYWVRFPKAREKTLRELFPHSLILAIGKRYKFSPQKEPFRLAIFAASDSFLKNSRIDYRRKTGQAAQTQKKTVERLKTFEKFIDLFDLTPDYDAFYATPPEHPALLKLERIVLDAIKYQDEDRAISDVAKFLKEYSKFDETLAEIHVMTEHYATIEAAPSNGRPTNIGAFQFVATLADFWSEELKRPVTLDAFKGEGLTETCKFIRDCATPLNTLQRKEIDRLSDGQINTMIRKYQLEKPKWKNHSEKLRDQ